MCNEYDLWTQFRAKVFEEAKEVVEEACFKKDCNHKIIHVLGGSTLLLDVLRAHEEPLWGILSECVWDKLIEWDPRYQTVRILYV